MRKVEIKRYLKKKPLEFLLLPVFVLPQTNF